MLKSLNEVVNMQKQRKKLLDLHDRGLLSNAFLEGYILAYVESFPEKQYLSLRNKLIQMESIVGDNLITAKEVIEIIQVAMVKSMERNNQAVKLDRFFMYMHDNLNQAVTSSGYLNKKYYTMEKEEKKEEQKVPLSLGKNGSKLGLQCSICCEQITLSSVCPVACGHNLHHSCFNEYFKSKVEVKSFPILCPEENCGKEIQINDIEEYIKAEIVNKYLEFSLHEFVDRSKCTNWCPTPGCLAVFEVDGQQRSYNCGECGKNYCLKCKTDEHKHLTCQQNMELLKLNPADQEVNKFLEGSKCKRCPSCHFWVEKNKGCDHITCRCGYEFCFRCGAKYGNGDCNCDENDSFYGDDDDDDDIEIQNHRIRSRFSDDSF